MEVSEEPLITTSTDIEIIPITLNYKYECELSDKLNWYAGAGAGIALVDVDFEESSIVMVLSQNLMMTPHFMAIFLPALFTMSVIQSKYLAARATSSWTMSLVGNLFSMKKFTMSLEHVTTSSLPTTINPINPHGFGRAGFFMMFR